MSAASLERNTAILQDVCVRAGIREKGKRREKKDSLGLFASLMGNVIPRILVHVEGQRPEEGRDWPGVPSPGLPLPNCIRPSGHSGAT